MEIDEQKKRVTAYFGESKGWQGDLYSTEESYFSRVIIRRKQYAFEMIRSLPDLKIGKVLDIGCGSGVYLREFFSMGFDCYGVDISQEMVDTCKNLLEADKHPDRVHVSKAEVEHLPFQDGEFDLVICIGVLGYLLRDEKALSELKRIVKPGGYLLVNLTNMYSSSDADYVWRKKLKALFSGKPANNEEMPAYAIPNEWMLRNRQFHFKSYNLWMYEPMIERPNFRKIDAMTYGYEFRILRRLPFIPESFLFALELFLEELFRRVPVPVLSYTGWVYTGIYKRLS
jgi:ubiquinone/menaquinone biosynthesis C-methylase UbiE